METEKKVAIFREVFERVQNEIAKVIVGHTDTIQAVIICLLSDGHGLIEGVPGLGKTLLVRTLSRILNLKFSRIQFTPDLMPADITGTNVVMEKEDGKREFSFQKGPVFANIILADEINRATPKTQSALLEAMQEHSVTVTDRTYKLEEPFFVLATQNPIEMEGTYPLPEAQVDRFFFKLKVSLPNLKELTEIIDRTTGEEVPQVETVADRKLILDLRELARCVPAASHVKEYAGRLALATQPDSAFSTEKVKKYVRYGASPRGSQSLILAGKIKALLDGRYNVSFSDIRSVVYPSLRHRLILNFEGQAEGIDTEEILSEVIEKVPEREL